MFCHMYGAMPLFAMPCICELEYEKQTSYIWIGIHGWRFLFWWIYWKLWYTKCRLKNFADHNSFQLIFLFSYLNSYVNIYMIYVNMGARYYISYFFYFRIVLLILSLYHVFPQLILSKLLAFNTYHVFWAESFLHGLDFLLSNGGQQYQIRGIRVTKDWYFSIILNSTPMIFQSLWIKCEFAIFDLQLNFLVRFDER